MTLVPSPSADLEQALRLLSVTETVICQLRSLLASMEGSEGWWGKAGDRSGIREADRGGKDVFNPLVFFKAAKISQCPLPVHYPQPILSVFPVETLMNIISLVPDKPTLSVLSRTCSTLCELASPFLFGEMTIKAAHDLNPFSIMTPLLSSIRPRTSLDKVRILTLFSYDLVGSARQPYPVISLPALETGVVRCCRVRGGQRLLAHARPESSTQSILHECVDVLSPLHPFYLKFEPDCPSLNRRHVQHHYQLYNPLFKKILDSPSWKDPRSVTYTSLFLNGCYYRGDRFTIRRELDRRFHDFRRIFDYSQLIRDFDENTSESELAADLESVDTSTDVQIVMRRDQVGPRRLVESLEELEGFEVVFKE